jgi:hypothetical protein
MGEGGDALSRLEEGEEVSAALEVEVSPVAEAFA